MGEALIGGSDGAFAITHFRRSLLFTAGILQLALHARREESGRVKADDAFGGSVNPRLIVVESHGERVHKTDLGALEERFDAQGRRVGVLAAAPGIGIFIQFAGRDATSPGKYRRRDHFGTVSKRVSDSAPNSCAFVRISLTTNPLFITGVRANRRLKHTMPPAWLKGALQNWMVEIQ